MKQEPWMKVGIRNYIYIKVSHVGYSIRTSYQET